MGDPTGKNLPWKPPTIWEALGDEFLSGPDGDTVELSDLKGDGKVIGLYFSAHWCPPCRQFTPMLVDAYKKHLKAKNLEVIFVSSDKSPQEFAEYYGTMPWLAIPQGDKRKEALSKALASAASRRLSSLTPTRARPSPTMRAAASRTIQRAPTSRGVLSRSSTCVPRAPRALTRRRRSA